MNLEFLHFLISKHTIIKVVCHWHIDQYRRQWNKTEHLEINPYIYSQRIFDKGPRLHNGELSVFLWKKWFRDSWISIWKRIPLDSYLIPYTKITWKWIKNVNLRPKTIKLLGKKHRGKHQTIRFGNDFLGKVWKTQAAKTK